MYLLCMAQQAQFDPGTNTGSLAILNTLGIAIFLVGMGFIILMVVHYYRVKDRQASDKPSGSGRRSRESDTVSQFQYMSRDEIKQMILAEKARKEGQDSGDDKDPRKTVEAGTPLSLFDNPVEDNILNSDSVNSDAGPETGNDKPMVTVDLKTDTAREADLLARLLISESDTDEDNKTEEKQPVKPDEIRNPYVDNVVRSPLSNELPDEFKNNSRKI